jgi:hypothetical protein
MVQDYQPNLFNNNKLDVYDIACPQGCTHKGEIALTRWQAMPLPETIQSSEWDTMSDIRADVFGYESTTILGLLEWYLNFAHHNLFCAYGGPLLAQDELQVAEHPALGSLREALLSRGEAFGVLENGVPTPVLIRNVERRCSIDTRPNREEGRPYGLYGKEFARAQQHDILHAVKPIVPPTYTNIIAMEAPTEGYGKYSAEEVVFILSTAFTGFSAARQESLTCGAKEVAIHTGFWGCGAYGGNRVLMTLLQLLAANLANINRLIYHTVDTNGAEIACRAIELFNKEFHSDSPLSPTNIIEKIVSHGFEWGESDGN